LADRIRHAARRALAWLTGQAIIVFARFVTAPQARWQGATPERRQRIYFANHTSNGDFVLIWAVLPPAIRRVTRPVAAADYWLTTPLRRFIGIDVLRAVLIQRRAELRTEDPVAQMVAALDGGASLILFPEGTRNPDGTGLLPFKPGLFHVAVARPGVDLVPVHVANLNHVMPKGEVIPVPLICTVTFGPPMRIEPDEPKDVFLARARAAVMGLNGAGAAA
jgi:1-acyl-sn-glycerol-3-phosphate acyltransferase